MMIWRIFATLFFLVMYIGCKEDSPVSSGWEQAERIDIVTKWAASAVETIEIRNISGRIELKSTNSDTISITITRICEAPTQELAEQWVDSLFVTEEVILLGYSYSVAQPESLDLGDFRVNFVVTLPHSIDLFLKVVNGAIEVKDHQASLTCLMTNGSIDCDLAQFPADEQVSLTNNSGDVVLSLRHYVSTSFNIGTVNGSVAVEGFASVVYHVNELKNKRGDLGAGDASVVASTVNGVVTLRER